MFYKIFFIAVFFSAGVASAQQRFELVAPDLRLSSQATRTDRELQVIASDGSVSTYRREPQFDSSDQSWLGYYDRASQQIIRWPVSESGNMQIGTLRGNSIEYRPSRMTIRAMQPQPRPTTESTLPPIEPSPGYSLQPRNAQRPVLPSDAKIEFPSSAGINSGTNTRMDETTNDQRIAMADLQRSNLFSELLARSGGQSTRGQQQAGSAQMLRLAAYDRQGAPWLLSRASGHDLTCAAADLATGADWWVAPAMGGYVRIQTYSSGRTLAVSATRSGRITMLPLSQDAHQLWRVVGGRGQQHFALENAFLNGQCLTHLGAGQLVLQPINFGVPQLWSPYVAPTFATYEPFWRSVSQQIHPNPQLPPAQLELRNSQRSALIVLLGDTRKGNDFETIRIEPNGSTTVALDRDAGATLVETIEIRSPSGVWDRQELITAIPPSPIYDLSVYEEHLQSIAIDRTGKSPNPIEDVNYVPKSIGWLPLPAGADLPPQGQLDVFSRARAANNPGAVRRLDPRQYDEPPVERPLESILNEFQSAPRKSF
ncbi:MAG: hypothetical protein R3C53_14285 [Pirellulaceae bacterium]